MYAFTNLCHWNLNQALKFVKKNWSKCEYVNHMLSKMLSNTNHLIFLGDCFRNKCSSWECDRLYCRSRLYIFHESTILLRKIYYLQIIFACLQFKCENCNTETANDMAFSMEANVPIMSGKANVNLSFKCKECKRSSTVSKSFPKHMLIFTLTNTFPITRHYWKLFASIHCRWWFGLQNIHWNGLSWMLSSFIFTLIKLCL